MRVSIEDIRLIDMLLLKVNGDTDPTYLFTDAHMITPIVADAENTLTGYLVGSQCKGTRLVAQSGERTSLIESPRVWRNRVTLERTISGWYIVSLDLYASHYLKRDPELFISRDQFHHATTRMNNTFSLLPTTGE